MLKAERGKISFVDGRQLEELYIDCGVTGHIHKESESSSKSSTDEDMYIRRKKMCGWDIWLLLTAMLACGTACFIMLSTNLFTLFVHKNLSLKKNTLRYETWRKPPVQGILRLYVFNYTNIKEYERKNSSRLKIQEVGPYTYIETLERVNVTHHENGTLTYKDKKSYKFSPELSNGSETDRVIVANIPFMGAMAEAKNSGFIVRVGILGTLRLMGAAPFINLSIRDFVWGYNDGLSAVVTNAASFKYNTRVPTIGILADKNRTQDDWVTISTGEHDVTKTGMILEYGNKKSLDYWHTQECNRIDGTDGTVYPAASIKPNSTLYLYVKDMCRRFPMVYNSSKVNDDGFSVHRYQLAGDVFESGESNEKNRCFCNQKGGALDCLPSGVFNVSPCAYGGPIITSLPHFLYGDPVLLKDFEGLSPSVERHESFVEIDKSLGLPVTAKSRFQLNVLLRKAKPMPYNDNLIIPVSWMDYGIDRLPQELSSQIHTIILLITMTEVGLSCSFAAGTVVFLAMIIRRMIPQRKGGLFIQNLHLSTADVPLVACRVET